jgi:hypothetical protein
MFNPLLRVAAPLFLLASVPLAAQQPAPVTAADMMRHIEVLASDAFEGRAPGSAGERLTTDYIVRQLQDRGFEAAGENGTWFQTLHIVETVPGQSRARWVVRGNPVEIAAGDMALIGQRAVETLNDAPVIFAGHGARMPDRGIDQLAGSDFHGAVALIMGEGPQVEGFPSVRERVRALAAAGAAAVIVVAGPDLPWNVISAGFNRGTTRLEADAAGFPNVVGIMPTSAIQRLVAASGGDFARLLNDQPGSSFRPVALPIRLSMEVATGVRRFATNNVLGRSRGRSATGEAVMFLAHWDHFGICRPEGVADRICNGAVDNASGVAMMIEVAGRLAQNPRPPRDILVLATTAEEEGLLRAEYFAAHPVVPLASIVAAINLDTVAVAPAGEPVAILNRAVPGLVALVESTAAAMGRRVDSAHEADAMTQRQDGWALARNGVPAIMVGGSFASMARLNRFLQGRYHQPSDQADGQIEMGGATEDANLLVALGRRLADPATYARPQRTAE